MITEVKHNVIVAAFVAVMVSSAVTSAIISSAEEASSTSAQTQPAQGISQPAQGTAQPSLDGAPGDCRPTPVMFDKAREIFGRNVRFDPRTCTFVPGPVDPSFGGNQPTDGGNGQGGFGPENQGVHQDAGQGSWGPQGGDDRSNWKEQAIRNGMRQSNGPFCQIPNSTAWTGDVGKCKQWGSEIIGGQGSPGGGFGPGGGFPSMGMPGISGPMGDSYHGAPGGFGPGMGMPGGMMQGGTMFGPEGGMNSEVDVTRINKQIKILTKQVNKMTKMLARMDKKIVKLKDKLSAAKDEVKKQKIQDAIDSIEEAKSDAQDRIDGLNEEIEDLQADLEDANAAQ